MPEPVSLQFDGRLTNIANAYSNPEYIAELVVPPTPVPNKKFTFKKYDKDSRFTVPDSKVGPKSTPNEVEWKTSDDSGTCEDHGFEEFVSDEEVSNAEAPITPVADTVDFVTGLVQIAKEKRIADVVFASANYATTVDIAGAWATLSFDALTQIETGIDACFMPPNVMVMGLPTWRALARNEKVLAAVKGTLKPQALKTGTIAQPAVNQQELAEYLGLDAVLVGRSRINTAKEGQTASYARIWDGTNATKGGAALLRVKRGAALKDAVWGALFHWKERQVFTHPTTRGAFGGQMIRVVESNVLKSISTDLGYLFIDCLVT